MPAKVTMMYLKYVNVTHYVKIFLYTTVKSVQWIILKVF